MFARSQWDTSFQSNAVSHWLGANIESALNYLSFTYKSASGANMFERHVTDSGQPDMPISFRVTSLSLALRQADCPVTDRNINLDEYG